MITFTFSDQHHAVVQSAGLTFKNSDLPLCPLQLGDVVAAAGQEQLYHRVVERILIMAPPGQEPDWFILLEPCPNPLPPPAPHG